MVAQGVPLFSTIAAVSLSHSLGDDHHCKTACLSSRRKDAGCVRPLNLTETAVPISEIERKDASGIVVCASSRLPSPGLVNQHELENVFIPEV